MERAIQTFIESIGVYLPPRSVSTEEVLRGCSHPIRFPLEQMTGIVTRRMAGESEFSLDLTRKAIESCLANSRRAPADIDLLICSQIARYDAPGRVTYEPSSSLVLKEQLGFRNAMVFDITNACAGMFSAIYLVDAMLKAGMIRCGLVASGEYITHLTETAQKEIRDYLDPRLACLTLGDAGAAVILEPSPSDEVGFHAIDLYTMGKYSQLCTAKPTDQEHGGAIMVADSIRAAAAVIEHTAQHAAHVLRESSQALDDFRHIIPHQTSRMSIKEGISEIARVFDKNLEGTLIDNVAHRGNTASTSHFVALMDQILDRRINSRDNVMFCFSGSGITVGTALYTLDDLPDRLRATPRKNGRGSASAPPVTAKWLPDAFPRQPRVRLEALGTAAPGSQSARPDTRELARLAAEACLARSSHDRREVDLLMNVGLYRTDFVAEPAVAAIAAGDLKMNDSAAPQARHKTVALDLINGSLGFLNACCVAVGTIRANRCENVMVIASEVENNADVCPDQRRGLYETGSAAILDVSPDRQSGFGSFLFKYFTEYLNSFTSCTVQEHGRTRMTFQRSPQLEDHYLECIRDTVREFLSTEGLDPSRLKAILPPQISSAFLARLADVLHLDKSMVVDVTQDGTDLFTSSTVHALLSVRDKRMAGPGDLGLIIGIGAGIQVGCALYHF
jgi:3-oxoacyl-[acyl-carrier-protein] synthase III